MGLTKLVLRRPVSTVLAILCLIVFGLSSVMKSPLELMPDMNMSMMIVMTVYSGASPDDVSELVTKPIEDRASTLSGLDTISSQSKENMSIVMLKYKYGTDMNDAYDDLKKQMDLAKVELPEDADDPIMLELNTSRGFHHRRTPEIHQGGADAGEAETVRRIHELYCQRYCGIGYHLSGRRYAGG